MSNDAKIGGDAINPYAGFDDKIGGVTSIAQIDVNGNITGDEEWIKENISPEVLQALIEAAKENEGVSITNTGGVNPIEHPNAGKEGGIPVWAETGNGQYVDREGNLHAEDVNEYEARYGNMSGLIIDEDPSETILDHEGIPDQNIGGDTPNPYAGFDDKGFLIGHEDRIAPGAQTPDEESKGISVDFESGTVIIGGKTAPDGLSGEVNGAVADNGFDDFVSKTDQEFNNTVADMDAEFEQEFQKMNSGGFDF